MTISLRPEVQSFQEDIIATRRDIHQHPELGFDVHRTAKLVVDRLKSYGLDVSTGIGKTGVVGDLRGNSDGPTIALRADMDALPIQETSDVPYKSKIDGVMHACGHDGHTAMLLGAAGILSQNRERINGTVRFIFQPAEEGDGGARYMIKDGCLDGVDEIFGIHLWNYQPFGEVGIQAGPILAAADIIDITISGIGGHGAAPQGTADAIVAAAELVNALQTIVSRNTNPVDSTVVTIGTIHGGHNFNVIADRVHLSGTARAYTEENRRMIKRRMHEILSGLETMYGVTAQLDYQDGYPPTVNHASSVQKVFTAAGWIVGKGAGKPYLTMGGEDFSYYLQKIPGCFFFIGSAPQDHEPLTVPHHCSHFDIDERALAVGTSIFVELIEQQLMQSD